MASKNEFLVIIPDKEGVLEKRMDIRPQHLKNIAPRVDEGFCTFGGAMLNHHTSPGESPSIKGSVMVVTSSSSEEALQELRKDVYAAEVWDLEKAQVIPFKTAVVRGPK